MPLSADISWNVRTDGAATNGGGFTAGASGTNHTLQAAAQYAVTDGVTDGSSTITSATANFGTDVVGNVMYVAGGTGSITAGRYEITARNSATSVTVDRSTGLTAGTGVTLNIGGALSSPGLAAGVKVAGNDVTIMAGTYTVTTGSSNVDGGTINESTGGVASPYNPSRWVGYQTTPGDGGTKPVIQINSTGVTGVTMFNLSGGPMTLIENLTLDGASKTSIRGVHDQSSGHVVFRNCKIMNMTNYGLLDQNNDVSINCEITGCSVSSAARFIGLAVGCYSHDNTIAGFESFDGTFVNCISESNSGASTDGFYANGSTIRCFGCVAYGNGRGGFDMTGNTARSALFVNCIAEGNTSYGFRATATASNSHLIHCAGYNNTAGNYDGSNAPTLVNFVALTGSPFTNAAAGDFTLNATADAGAACRAAGFPATITGATGTSYRDIGAMQHQDAGGGGAKFFGASMSGGFDC
ncbi:MAG: right-handed parallel beta-helix repeat-containing protein [Phycisphaerales bacterium]